MHINSIHNSKNDLGQFTNKGNIFEIDTPLTPSSWSNYLFNENYLVTVSQTGQGISKSIAPIFMEFTQGERQFYILDEDQHQSYNANFSSPGQKYQSYKCRHACGWSKIESDFGEISSSLRVFVPVKHPVEIWTFTVTNNSDKLKKISVFSAFSLSLRGTTGIMADYDENADYIKATGWPDAVFYDDWEKNKRSQRYVFLYSDRKSCSYDCSSYHFFGNNRVIPKAVANGKCSNTPAAAEGTIAGLHHRMEIAPGDSCEVNLVLGCDYAEDTVETVRKEINSAEDVLREFEQVEKYWDEEFAKFQIQTPDANFDAFVNFWLKKQVIFSSRINRGGCIFPLRNPLQDAVAYSMLDGEFAKKKIYELASLQETNGYLHMWQVSPNDPPIGKIGMNHLKHKDSQVWLIVCTCAIAQQLGDIEWLEKEVPYEDGSTGTLYEHLLKAVDYMDKDRGAHGLCLMGDGDWNDPLNGAGRLGKGESTWTTMGFKYSLMQLLPICQIKQDTASIDKFETLTPELDTIINEHCWDGNWYIAGFNDEGIPFGKAADEEGKILLNSQSWAIMSEVARDERLKKLLQTIASVDTPAGPLTISPAFTKWNPAWGRISLWVPGNKENGGIYCHAAMFKAFANLLLRRADEAYNTITKIMPTNPENPPEQNRQVPIFLPNCYFGIEDSASFGRSTSNIITGTAAWMMWLGIEYILGIRSTLDGLIIDPCLPSGWDEVKITHKYKSAVYNIKIIKTNNQTSTKEIRVDGNLYAEDILPYQENKSFEIEVSLSI